MNTKILYTNKYYERMKELNPEHIEINNGTYLIKLKYNKQNIEKLVTVLKKILFDNNPITKDSDKFIKIINEKEFNKEVKSKINIIFDEYDFLNIDGFVIFHLNDYKEKIDCALYDLVRNSLL